jgi:hypothetical protein
MFIIYTSPHEHAFAGRLVRPKMIIRWGDFRSGRISSGLNFMKEN